jgi:zinc transport system substrate-binding protein
MTQAKPSRQPGGNELLTSGATSHFAEHHYRHSDAAPLVDTWRAVVLSGPGALLAVMLLVVCGCHQSTPSVSRLATATSYLESAALEVLGEEQEVLRLAEPGTCPGHFDIRPSQAADLRRCRALLRFDFQSALDRVLESDGTNAPFVIAVSTRGGLCKPESYLSACRQIAEALVTKGQMERTNTQTRLQAATKRLEELSRQMMDRVAQAGLRGVPVITSVHQRDFCEWLGLNVVATFRAADTASVAEIDQAIGAGKFAGTKLVIANLPEGRRTADALAERLNARVVVFGNFPALVRDRVSFDDLLVGNVTALLNAAQPQARE